MSDTLPLFETYPDLARALPRVTLTTLPTPVDKVETDLELASFSIKRDNLCSALYGGNKVRKLELLLGRALEDGRKRVITFGAAGSNHALATAIYAKEVGMAADSVLIPQHRARSVQRNLLAALSTGVTLHPIEDPAKSWETAERLAAEYEASEGVAPMIVPMGGSSELGAVAFVNAAFELGGQIEHGESAVPDVVYVAVGTMGTAVGLVLGFAALRLPIKVVGVRVVADFVANEEKCRSLFQETNAMLRDADAHFPECSYEDAAFEMRHDFFGEDYALYTEESVAAVRYAKETLGMTIEGTYTGKALAALLHDSERGDLRGKRAMFWNTYNSASLEALTLGDYKELPQEFHQYFEDEMQALDR